MSSLTQICGVIRIAHFRVSCFKLLYLLETNRYTKHWLHTNGSAQVRTSFQCCGWSGFVYWVPHMRCFPSPVILVIMLRGVEHEVGCTSIYWNLWHELALRSNNEDLGVCFCSVLTCIQKPTYHALSTQKPWPEPLASAFQDLRPGQSHVQAMTLAQPWLWPGLAQPNQGQLWLAHGFGPGWEHHYL